MSNETISIEIPAPPPKGATEFEYWQWFHKAKNCLYGLRYEQQEPRELVRFFIDKLYPYSTTLAKDDIGNEWSLWNSIEGLPELREIGVFSQHNLLELHPRLTIRSDGKGGWVASKHPEHDGATGYEYPCDITGNPLKEDKPPVEGWVKEGDVKKWARLLADWLDNPIDSTPCPRLEDLSNG